ncbi:MAG: RNA-directed DNA polymerase [Planctomycetes bacterium]|nr:RNA-directed DNA polymerase [Planctomycetota bacterium]
MKRVGGLVAQILRHDNFLVAFHRAARGKRFRAEVREFQNGLPSWLASIAERLFAGSFTFGRFHQFLILDPKERIITAPCFEERVVHHAIMNICEPELDRWLIDDTFACRVGRGREAAVQRAMQFCRSQGWCLKLDIRKYFDSINQDRLLELLTRRFKEVRLQGLFEQIVRSFRGTQRIGLPIGSLMSQHFANFYLGRFDRYVKESLRVHGYVRYMDDLLLWGEDRRELQRVQRECELFVDNELRLEFKPGQVRRVEQGISFLGCRLFPTHVELNRRSKQRWQRRVRFLEKAYRLGLLSDLELQQRVTSLTAFARGACVRSWKFRASVLEPLLVDEP